MRKITKRSVRLTTGTEGPHWDPYHYSELTITTNIEKVMVHFGLAEYMEINNQRDRFSENNSHLILKIFESKMHVSYDSMIRAYYAEQNKCPNCGKTKFITANGYPGETLYICQRCNRIVRSHTNMAAII